MISHPLTSSTPRQAGYEPVRGAHIYVERGLYSHHGIDCGDGTVIDFAGQGPAKTAPIIRSVTLAEFAQSSPIRTRDYGSRYETGVVVARARSMIGRSGYDLFSNNCEHFATWCVVGAHSSAQVEAALSAASIFGIGRLAPAVGISTVAGLGETASRSASNVMSGLKRLGGSPAGGVTMLAGAGAVFAPGR